MKPNQSKQGADGKLKNGMFKERRLNELVCRATPHGPGLNLGIASYRQATKGQ
jgi:hypothetical protein